MAGRIDIKPDNIAQLVDELRVVGKLELVDPVRLETMRVRQMRWTELALIPTAFAIIVAVQWVASAGGSGPVGAPKPVAESAPDGWESGGSCLIAQEAVVTRLHEAVLPPPHTGLRLAGPALNLIGADTVCAQQNDLGPP